MIEQRMSYPVTTCRHDRWSALGRLLLRLGDGIGGFETNCGSIAGCGGGRGRRRGSFGRRRCSSRFRRQCIGLDGSRGGRGHQHSRSLGRHQHSRDLHPAELLDSCRVIYARASLTFSY